MKYTIPQSVYWIVAVFLLGLCLVLFVRSISNSFIFYPTRSIDTTPAAVTLPYEDIRIATEDGERIAGWFIPGPAVTERLPGSGQTVLFFHGNAGNISHRLQSISIFYRLGFSVLIIDYRGYGESTGSASVAGTKIDAMAAWKWLVEKKGIDPETISIFGRSLGGGVAASLAARVHPRAVILESTFTSLRDVAKEYFPWLPVGLLIPEEYDSLAALDSLGSTPLLVIHSREDEVIAYGFGKALYEHYQGPKVFMQIYGSHNGGYVNSIKQYSKGLEDFFLSLPHM